MALGATAAAVAASTLTGLPATLDWQPALAATEPWRWWTAAFVHLSPAHLAANLAGCAVLAAFGQAARLPPRWAAAWLAAWPLGHLGLLAVPALAHYAGLSGMLHAGVAVAALGLAWSQAGRRRTIGLAVLAGAALKVLAERPWQGAVQTVPGWDIPVAPAGHASGLLAGLVCAACVCALTPRQRPGAGAGPDRLRRIHPPTKEPET